MTDLYYRPGETPAPLPFAAFTPSGLRRTDLANQPESVVECGFILAPAKPADTETQTAVWDGVAEAWIMVDRPPPALEPEQAYLWLQFVDLFTAQEQEQLTAAAIANPEGVGLWYFKAVGTQGIRMSDPRTVEGVQALVDNGLISETRRDQILAGEAPPMTETPDV